MACGRVTPWWVVAITGLAEAQLDLPGQCADLRVDLLSDPHDMNNITQRQPSRLLTLYHCLDVELPERRAANWSQAACA